jgi:hypothetical protein
MLGSPFEKVGLKSWKVGKLKPSNFETYNRTGKLAEGLTETGVPCLLSLVMSGIWMLAVWTD